MDAAAVESFVVEMATAHDFDAAALRALFAQMRVDEKVVELMDAPRDPTKKTYWREYRARHLKPWIVAGGEDFLRRHRAAFARAEKKFGVPRHIAAAILGIETRFGGYLGNFSTAQALSTLAFAYPRRAAFFRGELAQFLLYARENGIDPLALRGSFAGAFGIPQFLPSNARRFAVDFDGDGKVDLFSPVDALGSAANFLVAHGWRRGLAVSHRFAAVGDTADFAAAGIKPISSRRISRRRDSASPRRRRRRKNSPWSNWKTATATNTAPARKTTTRSRATTAATNTRCRSKTSPPLCPRAKTKSRLFVFDGGGDLAADAAEVAVRH